VFAEEADSGGGGSGAALVRGMAAGLAASAAAAGWLGVGAPPVAKPGKLREAGRGLPVAPAPAPVVASRPIESEKVILVADPEGEDAGVLGKPAAVGRAWLGAGGFRFSVTAAGFGTASWAGLGGATAVVGWSRRIGSLPAGVATVSGAEARGFCLTEV
jgi:hypothetical protein